MCSSRYQEILCSLCCTNKYGNTNLYIMYKSLLKARAAHVFQYLCKAGTNHKSVFSTKSKRWVDVKAITKLLFYGKTIFSYFWQAQAYEYLYSKAFQAVQLKNVTTESDFNWESKRIAVSFSAKYYAKLKHIKEYHDLGKPAKILNLKVKEASNVVVVLFVLYISGINALSSHLSVQFSSFFSGD